MARDRANIRIDIWADEDWRDLPGDSQLLYLMLLSHATLNYAGVADWRPGRLAAMSAGGTVDAVEEAARILQDRHFILIDETTEEVLVRSFVKHDGILKQPKLSVAMANAYAGVASKSIRSVIAYEVQKMHERHPELSAWKASQVQTILDSRGSHISAFTPADTPAFTPADTPKLDQAQALPTTTATTTATRASSSSPAARVSEADFEKAYSHWPKKTERKKSFEKFRKVAAERGVDQITADVIRFGDAYARHSEKRFVPALVVWLNGERWTDELPGGTAEADDIRDGILFRNGKPVVGGPNGMTPEQYNEWLDRRAS